MKIKRFEVVGLFGRDHKISGTLSSDLNILTGRNGAGKTTVLKLIWYIMSGNILIALNEINFQKVAIETDMYECIVTRTGPQNCKVEFTLAGEERVTYEDQTDLDGDQKCRNRSCVLDRRRTASCAAYLKPPVTRTLSPVT